MPTTPPTKPRVAMFSDGYRFTEQPDGTWTDDGDMTWDSLQSMLDEDPDLLIDGVRAAPSETPPNE